MHVAFAVETYKGAEGTGNRETSCEHLQLRPNKALEAQAQGGRNFHMSMQHIPQTCALIAMVVVQHGSPP